MKEIISAIAGLLQIAGFFLYIRAILRKETVPVKASWIIWASLDTITIAGMYVKNTVNGQIIGVVLGVWIVLIFALKHGTPDWTKLDKFCFGGAVFGIALWKIFDNPVLGIVTSLSVLFLGSIPTFVSAWKDSSREDRLAWKIFWASCVCAVIAIPRWTLADAAQPIAFFTIDTIMICILFIRPYLLSSGAAVGGARNITP